MTLRMTIAINKMDYDEAKEFIEKC